MKKLLQEILMATFTEEGVVSGNTASSSVELGRIVSKYPVKSQSINKIIKEK